MTAINKTHWEGTDVGQTTEKKRTLTQIRPPKNVLIRSQMQTFLNESSQFTFIYRNKFSFILI